MERMSKKDLLKKDDPYPGKAKTSGKFTSREERSQHQQGALVAWNDADGTSTSPTNQLLRRYDEMISAKTSHSDYNPFQRMSKIIEEIPSGKESPASSSEIEIRHKRKKMKNTRRKTTKHENRRGKQPYSKSKTKERLQISNELDSFSDESLDDSFGQKRIEELAANHNRFLENVSKSTTWMGECSRKADDERENKKLTDQLECKKMREMMRYSIRPKTIKQTPRTRGKPDLRNLANRIEKAFGGLVQNIEWIKRDLDADTSSISDQDYLDAPSNLCSLAALPSLCQDYSQPLNLISRGMKRHPNSLAEINLESRKMNKVKKKTKKKKRKNEKVNTSVTTDTI